MSRKVIIDCDMGTDDAIALCLALFDNGLDVLAITAVEGAAGAGQANHNLQAIIEQLDPPRLPRLGAASPLPCAPDVETRTLHGDDGMGNLGYTVSALQHTHPSEKLICDVVRTYPNEVTLVTLGPLTNVARAFQRDPTLPGLLDRLVMTGGSPNCIGNITPSAEFNIYYDAEAAADVFRSRTTKTLIPLDVTRQVSFDVDLIDQLPGVDSRAGRLLRRLIPFMFRAYHERLGQESIHLNDVVGLVGTIQPSLFQAEGMAGDVETTGELTRGVTVFDRRPTSEWRENMEVVTVIDATHVREYILRGLQRCGQMTD